MAVGTTNNVSKRDKILIIEGHVVFGQQVAELLNNEGFETILVKNGVEAMKMIYDKLPRLIILNSILPDTDSYEILEKKNAEPLLKKIPVFLVSTQGMPINMRRIPQGSVSEFVLLFKADATELVDKVKNYLAGAIIAARPTADSREKKKLLWIEDDKLITNILSKKFMSSGFDLTHVINGEEALKSLETSIPNAIVLDLLLPGMGGLDIMQKIDMNPKYKKIPIMILSNLDKQSDRDKAKMLGAKKFLVKAGTSLDQIVEEIKEMCS
jgi:CheY-like chemotaxis protein